MRQPGADVPDRPGTGDAAEPRGLVARLVSAGDLPGDSRDTRLRKHAFTVTSAGLILVSVLWTLIGVLAERPLLTILSAVAFGTAVVAISVEYRRSKRLLRSLRLLLIAGLAYIAIGHTLLGGLVASGGALAWGVVVPVLALLLFEAGSGVRWLAVYVALVVAAVVLDPLIVAWAPATWVTPPAVIYAFNLLGPALILVLLVRLVDGERLVAQLQYHGLLLRILPAPLVERLTAGETRIAGQHPSVTVLFADIVGFTRFADRASPDEVLGLLSGLFASFDRLAAEAGVEKVKTIGDAYMAVAGAPVERADHADAALRLALAMQRTVAESEVLRPRGLAIRIGLASGPVTAGVIGADKPTYDVWGDTVNMASRMETTGVVGQIQMTQGTARELRGTYPIAERTGVMVKGKGEVTTVLLDPRRVGPTSGLSPQRVATPPASDAALTRSGLEPSDWQPPAGG